MHKQPVSIFFMFCVFLPLFSDESNQVDEIVLQVRPRCDYLGKTQCYKTNDSFFFHDNSNNFFHCNSNKGKEKLPINLKVFKDGQKIIDNYHAEHNENNPFTLESNEIVYEINLQDSGYIPYSLLEKLYNNKENKLKLSLPNFIGVSEKRPVYLALHPAFTVYYKAVLQSKDKSDVSVVLYSDYFVPTIENIYFRDNAYYIQGTMYTKNNETFDQTIKEVELGVLLKLEGAQNEQRTFNFDSQQFVLAVDDEVAFAKQLKEKINAFEHTNCSNCNKIKEAQQKNHNSQFLPRCPKQTVLEQIDAMFPQKVIPKKSLFARLVTPKKVFAYCVVTCLAACAYNYYNNFGPHVPEFVKRLFHNRSFFASLRPKFL